MRRELPAPKEIIEELVDKAALQIDRLAPVAFDAALDELMRYHRFLLNVNASQTPDGKPFNYAAVPGEAFRAPHNEWISQYRRLFERAASRIGDDPDFIEKLAYVPLRLLPDRGDPAMSDEVLQAIVDLGLVLIHQIEGWVTKRTISDTEPGAAAGVRMSLAGSDAKSYMNLLPLIVGAWESLLGASPSIYNWRNEDQGPAAERWDLLRRSWPFLWQHLRNTAYMLAVSVWNEDETGAVLFRDALVRWPQTLSHHFSDRAYLYQHRLLFPDIFFLDLETAQGRIKHISPQGMPPPSPQELFCTALYGVHDDVLLLTAALLLSWSMDQKQVSDIGARTASTLLHRQLEDSGDPRGQPKQSKSFASLAMDIIRIEIAGDYGAALDGLVTNLDNMTERRVVPGRVFTPSTLHDRGGLQAALLVTLLARAPENEGSLVKRIQDLANNEPALPMGDRSLRNIVRAIDRFVKMLENSPIVLQRGLALLKSDADFSETGAWVQSALSSSIETVEVERKRKLKEKPVSEKVIDNLRDAAEHAMMVPPGGVFFFREFSIDKMPERSDSEVFTLRYNGLTKGQFVDPPMEAETVGFANHYAKQVAQSAGRHAWDLFIKRIRETVAVSSFIEELTFWQRVKVLAADVGAEPLLIISRQAQNRVLRKLVRNQEGPSASLNIERKGGAVGNGGFYIATIEGIDVYGADFSAGKAWLFSPYLLRSLQYSPIDKTAHILRVCFQSDENLTGSLVADFIQDAVWADWTVYEIDYSDS